MHPVSGMLDLYTWHTPNGRKPAILLAELEVPYEVHLVDLAQGEQKRPEYLELNPNGKIPALVDTDSQLGRVVAFESGAILVHLAEKFGTLGAVTAKMHAHARGWTRPAGFERLTWDFETSFGATPHWGRWRDGMGLDPAKEALFARAIDLIGRRLARFGKGPERFGLIHCDMRLANLLVDGDAVKVLDFDDCGFSWHLYDAATAVSFFEHEPHVPDLLAAWVEGYRRERDLPAEDEAEIPTFVMLRRMLLVAWIGSHAETDLAQSMGVAYSETTCPLCEDYLSRFG